MEEVNKNESWNKKRIIILVILLLLLIVGGYFLKTRFLVDSSKVESVKGIGTEVAPTEPAPRINIQEAVKEKIDSLKQQVSSLNVAEIASTSPQVQKILNDIKSLEQYPVNQVQEICRKICGL